MKELTTKEIQNVYGGTYTNTIGLEPVINEAESIGRTMELSGQLILKTDPYWHNYLSVY